METGKISEHLTNVLILEDEAIIAIDLEDMLTEMGARRIIALDTSAGAMEQIELDPPSFAVLDPRVKDGYCSPVVKSLKEKRVPFIIFSGDPVGAQLENSSFENAVWLMKPTTPESLAAAVEQAVTADKSPVSIV
jgi:DNA-binding response OmpR family regulator